MARLRDLVVDRVVQVVLQVLVHLANVRTGGGGVGVRAGKMCPQLYFMQMFREKKVSEKIKQESASECYIYLYIHISIYLCK